MFYKKSVLSNRFFGQILLSKIDHNTWLEDRNKNEFDNEPFFELMSSIENDGLQNPPVLMMKSNGDYKILSGKRRVYAYKKLDEKYSEIGRDDYSHIPASIIDEKEITHKDIASIGIGENKYRQNIDPQRKAIAILSSIAMIASVGNEFDTIDDLVNKGVEVFNIAYFNHDKPNQICSLVDAVKALDALKDSTGIKITDILKSIKIKKMPDSFVAAINRFSFSYLTLYKIIKNRTKNKDGYEKAVIIIEDTLSIDKNDPELNQKISIAKNEITEIANLNMKKTSAPITKNNTKTKKYLTQIIKNISESEYNDEEIKILFQKMKEAEGLINENRKQQ